MMFLQLQKFEGHCCSDYFLLSFGPGEFPPANRRCFGYILDGANGGYRYALNL